MERVAGKACLEADGRILAVAGPVEAVVVNYNAGEQLESAVRSLIDDGISKVWIVDNGSEDGSIAFIAAMGDSVSLLTPTRNLGYGRAANMGFESTSSRYVVICNPDIQVRRGAMERMIAEIETDSDCAVVGPRILGSDGSVYPSVRYFPSLLDAAGHAILGQLFPQNPFTLRYKMVGVDHSACFDADWVSGAFLLVRADAFRKVGGFNEKFFMYLEDVFLCREIQGHGYKVKFCGEAVVVHEQGISTDKRPVRMLLAHHRSLWTYARLTKTGFRTLELLPIGLGIGMRLVISLSLDFLGQKSKNRRHH